MMRTNTQYQIADDPLFQQMMVERNLKPESVRHYKKALTKYCEYNNLTLTELLEEADLEEEQGVRAKNRKVVQRLRGFRTHLIQKDYAPITTNHYYAMSKSFYRHFLIEVPYIPTVKLAQKQHLFNEIPKKENIIEALHHTNNLKHRAIIYFMCSSGTARNELSHITIQDFIDATSEYHNSTNIYDVVCELEKQDNVIPIFQLTRIKTNYIYFTLITPEATNHLIRYLKTRPLKRLRPTQTLFDIQPNSITIFFERLSRKCNYPPNFFHPHSLRKYHADILQNWDLTNRLQGRKPQRVREIYDKVNPYKLKKEYMKHIEDLTLKPVRMVTIEDEEVKILKKENKQIKKENEELKLDVEDLRNELHEFGELLMQSLKKNG